MNPNQPQGPQGPQRELTDEALSKKFSYAFTRSEIFAIRGALVSSWKNFGLGDVRVFLGILDKIEPACTLTNQDYKKEPKEAEAPETKKDLAVN